MEVLQSLWNVVVAVAQLLLELVAFIAPWAPLIAWIAFWLLAVNWKKLYPILMDGGLVGVVLIALMAILVWSVISEPADGYHHLYGLQVSNIVGKTVYVTCLTVIAFLCGTVQLSGACNCCCNFADDETVADSAHH